MDRSTGGTGGQHQNSGGSHRRGPVRDRQGSARRQAPYDAESRPSAQRGQAGRRYLVSDEDVDRLIRGELVEDWTMALMPRFAPLPSSSQEHRVEASQSPRGRSTTPRMLQHGYTRVGASQPPRGPSAQQGRTRVAASQPPRGPSAQQGRVTSVAPIQQPEFGQGRPLAQRIGPTSGHNVLRDIARQNNVEVVDNFALRVDTQTGQASLHNSSRGGGRQSGFVSALSDSSGRVSMVGALTPGGPQGDDMAAIYAAVDFMEQTDDGSQKWAVMGVNRKVYGNEKSLLNSRSIGTSKPITVNRSRIRRPRSRVCDQEGDAHSVHMDLDEVDESFVEESDFAQPPPAAALDRSLDEIVGSRGDEDEADDDEFVQPPLGRVHQSGGNEDEALCPPRPEDDAYPDVGTTLPILSRDSWADQVDDEDDG